MTVLGGQHRHARGRAERGCGVGIVEHNAFDGQPIEGRRVDDRIAVATGDVLGVLVREDKQKIGAIVGHVGFLPDATLASLP
jgi:hypothetical protein